MRHLFCVELGGPALSQEKILLIAAMAVLVFVLLVQAIHKLVGDYCCKRRNDDVSKLLFTFHN